MTAFDEMARRFAGAGLAVPPLPDGWRDRLGSSRDWLWSTRDVDPDRMYMFFPDLLDAIAEPTEDYMAVCHAGHGVNSYAVNYQLVYGPVVLFTQIGFGGVYTDGVGAAADLGEQFALCRRVIDAVDRATGLAPPPARLLAAHSDLRGVSFCQWLPAPLGAAAGAWLRELLGDRDMPGPVAGPTALERALAQLGRDAASEPGDRGRGHEP